MVCEWQQQTGMLFEVFGRWTGEWQLAQKAFGMWEHGLLSLVDNCTPFEKQQHPIGLCLYRNPAWYRCFAFLWDLMTKERVGFQGTIDMPEVRDMKRTEIHK